MEKTAAPLDHGWPSCDFLNVQCPSCKTIINVEIERDCAVRPFSCDDCYQDLVLLPDGTIERETLMTLKAQDRLIQEHLAIEEGVSFDEAAKWIPEREPALPSPRDLLEFQERTGQPSIEFNPAIGGGDGAQDWAPPRAGENGERGGDGNK